MKAIAVILGVFIMALFRPAQAATTVVDFEENMGTGIAYDADFARYLWGPGQAHSGDFSVRANRITEGWKECFFNLAQPDQRFVGAWVSVWQHTLQFRMYKDGLLVGISATAPANHNWVFLPSGYDGAVDRVGVWGYRGYYLFDDLTFATIERPPAPRTAQATATVVGGKITGFTVLDPGYGYRSVPKVAIKDETGVEAVGTAMIVDQKVQSIIVVNGGRNYSSNVLVRIGLPDFVAGIKVSISKIKVEMTLDVGQHYQLYSSTNLKDWSIVGEPFTAVTDSKAVEFEAGAGRVYYQLRRLD